MRSIGFGEGGVVIVPGGFSKDGRAKTQEGRGESSIPQWVFGKFIPQRRWLTSKHAKQATVNKWVRLYPANRG
jgi:hypothetical protein